VQLHSVERPFSNTSTEAARAPPIGFRSVSGHPNEPSERARPYRAWTRVWRAAVAGVIALAPFPVVGAGPGEGRLEPYRLPLARTWLNERVIMRPHHDHPAADLFVPTGTPVFAVQAGKIRAVLRGSSCGNGIVIDAADGFTHTYCHGSKVLVSAGEWVNAGDRIMLSGNTGSSGRPHLHLEIEDAAFRNKCPQPLLLSWWKGGNAGPRSAPYRGCTS
jgi:murein DD-endopeptidase MepM/ murein hydrolase activator NlpD